LAVGGLAVVYPWALDSLLERLGVRALAGGLLALLIVSIPVRAVILGGRGLAPWLSVAGLAGLLAAAAVGGTAVALRLVPAWVYACLAGFFAASLRAPDSVIERGARWIVPVAPTFIRGYCRKATGLWVLVFLGTALATAVLAVAGDTEAWRTFTSRSVWLLMGAVAGAEFLFRKTWFRYYARGGPFERFWSTLFPAERTERGRRSTAYIRRMRGEQRRAAEAAVRTG
jgi:uncharacterized membrane protein